MAFGKDIWNLEKQFIFYASYHHNTVNVAIHLLCVWPILISGTLLLQHVPAVTTLGDSIKVNLALVILIYVATYLTMDPLAGSVASMMVVTMYFATLSLAAVPGVWKMALAIHVGGWVPQFIGHGIFERRAPALLDSLDQALLTAPLFIILEVFFFFGYRREFYKKMMKQVEVNIKEFKEGKKNKK